MTSQTKTCQNCKADFVIEPDDFAFYEKIKVPPPTWCPECRQQRRYSWRNDRNLYKQKCGLCGKNIVTMYSPNKPFIVYCSSCWWSDKWDGTEYGQDFDFNRSFFEQFRELQVKVPRIALLAKNSINSEYTNHSSDNKNCFMSASLVFCEDVLYSNFAMECRNIMDCLYFREKGERCYWCTDCGIDYRCQYSTLLKDCSECYYCYDCRGCNNCFLSTNLRNKSYVFLNKQLTKEEYKKKMDEYNLGSYEVRERLYKQYLKLVRDEALHKYATIEYSNASSGNMIFNSKNANKCFDVLDYEDTKYCTDGTGIKDSMDTSRNAFKIELAYESHALIRNYLTLFCNLSYDDSDIQYCDNSFNSQNLFGCVGLKKGEYLILNKRYSKEEYESLKAKIIAHMKTIAEYGEFFPVANSPFGYNESHGQIFFPLTRDEVLKRGWQWEDNMPRTEGRETLKPEDIPDDIADIDESVLKQILECISCGKNYNIVKPEFDFYKKEKIPVTRMCYDCRDNMRLTLRPPRKLWKRQCVCDYEVHSNTVKHGHHETGRCPNEFETSYSPDRPEIVYCEQCYQAEVV